MKVEAEKQDLVEKDRAHLWHSMAKYNENTAPMIVSEGDGSWFKATDGKKYLDGVSGLWCLNLGHGRQEIAQAAYDQLLSMSYSPLTMSHVPAIELSTKISEQLGGSYTTYFSNSGSEANEVAFKIARQYHAQNGKPEKYKIISRYRAYHGSTLGALSATAQANRKTKYGPSAPGFLHVPPPYSYRSSFGDSPTSDLAAADYVEEVINWEEPDTVAAIILEPYISGGGVIIPSADYLTRVAEICRKYDVLLILDEVVSGFGRTGKMFGFMHSDKAQPDIITMAKGLTSGYLPLGATAVRSDIYEQFKGQENKAHFRHISTFGGHPAACAVALKSIDILERERIVERVANMSQTILSKLHQLETLPQVGEVRGIGFLYGIELVEDKQTKAPLADEKVAAILAACKEKGLIIGRNGDTVPGYQNVLIIAPPLSSTEDDLHFLTGVIDTVLREQTAKL